MTPLYPRSANTMYRAAIVALVLVGASLVVLPMIYVRTPYNTSQFIAWDQPVEFDHRHHVLDNGIECLYCHSSAERSPSAGLPTTEVCMGCHTQVWDVSPQLEVVRRSYFANRPIRWRRVHDLPDFVYFDHSVHIAKGIQCARCHGAVENMARVVQVQPLTMGWCLDCHRAADQATAPHAVPTDGLKATVDMFTDAPAKDRSITPLTTCTACHR